MKTNNRFLTTMLTSAALVTMLSANAGAVKAVPSTHKLYVNNQPANAAAYNIEGNNYFKLRDIAKLVNFGVGYNAKDNIVYLYAADDYQETAGAGGETKTPIQTAEAQISPQSVQLYSTTPHMTVYNINGNNYFKLRELGETIGFKVEFDAGASRVDIATPIISWNNEMDEFNNAVTACMGDRRDKPYTPTSAVCEELKKVALEHDVQIAGRKNFLANENERLLTLAATLDDMKDAPIETTTNKPVNLYLADEMRLLAGRAHRYNWGVVAEQPNSPTDTESEKPADTSAVTEEDLRAWELEMVDAVNEERRKAGVPELEISDEAMAYARYWAEHLKTDFRHSIWNDFRVYGKLIGKDEEITVDTLEGGENIVRFTGGNPVGHPMKALIDSPGHKATMLSTDWTHIGIGYAVAENGEIFCVQSFPLL